MNDGFFKDVAVTCFKLSSVLPDSVYLRMAYRIRTGKKLNLKSPATFNEKIQWMKLNDHNPLYTLIADKYEVRDYVRERIGNKYLVRLYGVYDCVDDIPFGQLPQEFVLKATHDSGGICICRNKEELDLAQAKSKLAKSLKRNFYYKGREWCYKQIVPRIVCEELLRDPSLDYLPDYKFFCFDGTPRALFVATERGRGTKFDFYDMDFRHLDVRNHYPNSQRTLERPRNFDKMIELAGILSTGFKQVRVDFYNIEGRIYFGELTLYHFSGFERFEPDSFDYELGNYWKI